MQETQETRVITLSQEDLLEEEMATCFGILAWEIPWTEERGRLQSNHVDNQKELDMTEHTHTHTHTQCKHRALKCRKGGRNMVSE